jgi:aryl-alcohol dehydrogenase (NADP+)
MYQLEQAIEASDIVLTADEIEAIEKPYRPHPVLGHQ